MRELLKEHFEAHKGRTYFSNNDMPAAVLVPLLEVEGELHILFEVRGKDMRRQPGEISFPGGRYEVEDASPWLAALREAKEELGIPEEDIEYMGTLDYYAAPTGVRIYPFIGFLHNHHFQPHTLEVDELFTVPLKALLTIEPRVATMQVATSPLSEFPYDLLPNYEPRWKFRKTYEVYFYPYKDKVIWGLTGTVLKNFLDIYRKIM